MNRLREVRWLKRLTLLSAAGWTLAVAAVLAAEWRIHRQTTGTLYRITALHPAVRSDAESELTLAKSDGLRTMFGYGVVWTAGLIALALAYRRALGRIPAGTDPGFADPADSGAAKVEPGQEERLQNRQLQAFHRISEVMQAENAGPEVFNTIAREISEMSDFPIVTIEVCNFDRAVMVVRGAHGLALEDLPVPFELPMDVTPSGEVARTGRVLVETHASGRREYAAPYFKQLGIEIFLCAPIKIRGAVAGTLSLAHREPIPFEPRVVRQVESLANYLATLFGQLNASDAMHRGEAELAAVYDRAPSVLCLFDERLQIVRANRAAAEFAGRDHPGPAPMSAAEFFRCPSVAQTNGRCFSGTLCQECELCRAVKETFRDGNGWQRVRARKLLSRNQQLQEAVVLVSTERIQFDGTVRVLMCLEDVTEQERADEQIRSQAALLDITRDAIVVRDFEDRILFWNEGAHRMYGWTAAEVLHKTMSEVLLGPNLEPSVEALRTVREKEDWTGEMKHRTRKGAEITVQSRWTLVRERNGAPKAILVVSTDVTERKRLEAQLLRAQRLESVGTLASGLAHDLNNVLAPIMMATQFLEEEARDDASRAWLQTLETCCRRGADIVRQVLMFARGVEGSRVILQPKHLVQEIERIARETFPKSIEIRIRLGKEMSLVEGDATQVQQVLMNLCVNARDAMPDGGTLTLGVDNVELNGEAARLHPKARPGRYVFLSVADTGTGIPPELIDKIFDPFFTTKPIGHGTGLGLPTVLGIAESHGGFVLVESEMGKGTAFKVYFPAAQVGKINTLTQAERVAAPKGNGEVILVVDDEPAIRKITYVILTKNGYQAFLASNGREALELYQQHQDSIKLVIADLMMPKMDGPSTIRALREIRPGIKTITITGMGEENKVSAAKAAGSDDFLTKPFTSEQLLVKLAQLLNKK